MELSVKAIICDPGPSYWMVRYIGVSDANNSSKFIVKTPWSYVGMYQLHARPLSLWVFPIKVVNVPQPRGNGPDEGPLNVQVVPLHPYKLPCAVIELLCGGDHVDPLVHQLSRLFLLVMILSHFQEYLNPHRNLLCVCWSSRFWSFKEVVHSCGSVQFGDCQDVALEEGLVEGRREVDIVPCVCQGKIRL